MDGGSGLNILYIDTLDAVRIPQSELRLIGSPFHGVILGAQAYLLRQIDLPITFSSRSNFRSEVLTFEVVDFLGSYHAIFRRPCYTRFKAIPNYTYLKLKMLGPNGVITVSSAFSHAFECDRERYELATAVVNSFELSQLRELSTLVVLDYNKPTSSMTFHPLKETKAVGVNPTDLAKTGKLLRYIVSKCGIEANPKKIVAISNMGPIRNVKGIQRPIGYLAALSRFIS
ncbi:uncharacterized protein [Miscanthus floridulus]|uniref:uncharacterized protein n=1 Tax=Miscanthus floridulus TaxID=154761 RepID=UPI0034597847